MKTLNMTPALYDYVLSHTPMPHPALAALIAETAKHPYAQMQIAPDQGAFMHLLAKTLGAKRTLEIGCFTGYSAISVALALPPGGQVIALDVNPETAEVARRHAAAAGVGDKIDIRLAPALETLPKLASEFGVGTFDMAFIDADKANYDAYYEHCLKLVRKGGMILVDNVLWGSRVLDKNDASPDTQAIRALNDKLAHDERVDRMLLHISDGIFVLRKR